MKMLFCALLFACLGACTTYTTPGAGVSLASISDEDLLEAFSREPAAAFPANFAVARVQAVDYQSKTVTGYGNGAFSVLTTRDIEREEDFQRIAKQVYVSGVAPLTRILLPENLQSTKDLRLAAARLKADLLLVYTIDAEFRTESKYLGPLQLVTLGFLSSEEAFVTATCSFMIVDVRTGYIYGTGETTSTETQRSNPWESAQTIERSRRAAERRAFSASLGEFDRLWKSIVHEYTTS